MACHVAVHVASCSMSSTSSSLLSPSSSPSPSPSPSHSLSSLTPFSSQTAQASFSGRPRVHRNVARSDISYKIPVTRGILTRGTLSGMTRGGRRKEFGVRAEAGERDGSRGLPQEILEDSKFVPIREDDPRFGPPACLLVGFTMYEVPIVEEMFRNMGGDFLQLLVCTEKMAGGTLSEAMLSRQERGKVEVPRGLPRIVFLSGLTGEEIMMVVGEFPSTGLPPPAFAAMVPKNANKPMRELMEEIIGDHERLGKK